MSELTSIVSVGQAAAWLQASPSRIRAAAEARGIAPAVVINQVVYFHESDLETIRESLPKVQQP